MTVGRYIKAMRDDMKLSQEEFASLTFRTQAFISQVEREVISPTDDFLEELAKETKDVFLRAYLLYKKIKSIASMLINTTTMKGDHIYL